MLKDTGKKNSEGTSEDVRTRRGRGKKKSGADGRTTAARTIVTALCGNYVGELIGEADWNLPAFRIGVEKTYVGKGFKKRDVTTEHANRVTMGGRNQKRSALRNR